MEMKSMATKKSRLVIAIILMLSLVSFFSIPASVFAESNQGQDTEQYQSQNEDKGQDKDGFDKDGHDKDGYDKDGFKDGFDKDGHDKDGYDKDGHDKDGYDKDGHDKDGYDKDGHDKDGYDKDGYDKDGHDKDGHDKDGHDKDGYDKDGHDNDDNEDPAITCVVTFDSNGGTPVTIKSVTSGSAVGTLTDSTTTGAFTFGGWFTSRTGGSQFTETSTVSSNITVYAHWTQTVDPINLWFAADDYADIYINGVNSPIPTTGSWNPVTKLYVAVNNNPFIAAKADDLKNVIAGFKLVFKNSDNTYLTTNSSWYYYAGNEAPQNDVNNLDWNDKDYQASKGWYSVSIEPFHGNWTTEFPATANWIWSPSFIQGAMDKTVYLRSTAPAPSPTNFTVTYAALTGGTISGSAIQTLASGSTTSEVTAVPNSGYRFVSWDNTSTVASRSDLVSGNATYTATFALNETKPVTYTVTYVALAGGTISGSAIQTLASGSTTIEVTAVPNSGYHFVSWDNASTVAGRSDLVSGNNTYTATFAADVVETTTRQTPRSTPTVPVIIEEPEVLPAGEAIIPVTEDATPGAPTELPKTGGLDPSLLYGLGALLAGSGLVIKRRKDK
jgi:LPXTG-motif cell wall-anchored protein